MSRTGSSLIINLRHPNDFKKAVQTQNELLKIAIANDANIALARKNFANQEPVFLTQKQSMSAEELEADQSLQFASALTNLLNIGFREDEAKDIVNKMSVSPDLLYKFNLAAPAIKEDIHKRFDIKLLTPTYFLIYLLRYIEELDEASGLAPVANSHIKNKFDDLTRSVNDIYEIIPSRSQIEEVYTGIRHILREARGNQQRDLIQVQDFLYKLIDELPTRQDLAESISLDQVDRMTVLQNLQNVIDRLPSQEDFMDLTTFIANDNYNIREKLEIIDNKLGGLDNEIIEDLHNIREDLHHKLQETGVPQQIIHSGIEYIPLDEIDTFSAGNIKAYIINLITLGERSNVFFDTSKTKATQTKQNAINFLTNNDEKIRTMLGVNRQELARERELERRNPSSSTSSTSHTQTTRETGFGIKTHKIGRGLSIPDQPKYLQFGKYVLDKATLDNKNILNFKHKSLGPIPKFNPLPITDETKEFVSNLVETGKANQKHFNLLPKEHRNYLYKVIKGSGLLDHLKLKNEDDDNDEENRFEILKDEFISGNNSIPLLRELKHLIIKFSNEGKITKRQMNDLLLEIS